MSTKLQIVNEAMLRLSGPLTKDEAIAALKDLQTGSDIEAEHAEADDVIRRFLLGLGHDDLVREFLAVEKWYA